LPDLSTQRYNPSACALTQASVINPAHMKRFFIVLSLKQNINLIRLD
jgi:hypothetical protein